MNNQVPNFWQSVRKNIQLKHQAPKIETFPRDGNIPLSLTQEKLWFIEQLKAIDKSLILLYLEGYSYQEIAEITGFTLTNVSTRISRIKKELKRKFESIKPKHNE